MGAWPWLDRPTSKASLLALKAEHPDAKLVVGNTEVGIEMKFKDARYPVLIGATHVPELNKVWLRAWATVPCSCRQPALVCDHTWSPWQIHRVCPSSECR